MFDVKAKTSPKVMDCGATCLQMMLDYYGVQVDLDTLVEDCNTKLYGCSAKDLKQAGIKHGLDMRAYKMTAEELFLVDRPAIIHWKDNHFCVFCGLNEEGKVVICNPDMGRFGIKKGIFKAFYCEVALFNGAPEDLTEPVTIFDKVRDIEAKISTDIVEDDQGNKYKQVINDGKVTLELIEDYTGMCYM